MIQILSSVRWWPGDPLGCNIQVGEMSRTPTEYVPKINLSLPLQYSTAHTKMYKGSLMTVVTKFVCVFGMGVTRM